MGIRTQQRYPDFPKAVRAWSEDPDHSEVVELGWPDRKTGEQPVLHRYSREECLGRRSMSTAVDCPAVNFGGKQSEQQIELR